MGHCKLRLCPDRVQQHGLVCSSALACVCFKLLGVSALVSSTWPLDAHCLGAGTLNEHISCVAVLWQAYASLSGGWPTASAHLAAMQSKEACTADMHTISWQA